MTFSILVGLALDYDILIMTRVVEMRKIGWSDHAAVCLAIDKTGGIITSAGLIMAISFAGLLIPKTTVLNQYGFALFMGVLMY
jgi:RND superfamily putative drug exporter